MSRIGYYDNAERRTTFRDLLKAYDVYGYRAMIMHPVDVTGIIVDQRGHGPGAIFVLQLDEPITFIKYCVEAGLPMEPRENKKAVALWKDFSRLGFVQPPNDHAPLDWRDALVTHLWAQWQHVVLINMQRGQPVEYVESESSHVASIKSTPGIIQNVIPTRSVDAHGGDSDVIELFLVHPVSWVRIPRAMDTDYLKPEHVSAWTDRMVVRSTYLNWKEKSPETLPTGKMSEDGKEYILDSPIPLEQVNGICSSTLTDKERILRCWLGAAMFHVVPIVVGHNGTFRPMRTEVARESIPFIVGRQEVNDALGRPEDYKPPVKMDIKPPKEFEENPIYPADWSEHLPVDEE